MKEKRNGSIVRHHGYWFYMVKLPGSDRRRMMALRAPGATHGLAADRPRTMAEQAAARLWEAAARRKRQDMDRGVTVDDVCARYERFCETYYDHGGVNRQIVNVRLATRTLRGMYGSRFLSELVHADMLRLRDAYVARGVARVTVNRWLSIVKLMITWALDEAIIPAVVKAELTQVRMLKRGRSAARECAPVMEVPDDVIERTLPAMMPNLADMVRVHRLTGMRPGEICEMTWGAIDRSQTPWVYRPPRHKNDWRGEFGLPRAILIGPRAREILLRHEGAPGGRPFSPLAVMAEHLAARREARATPVQPSQRDRSKAGALRKPGLEWKTNAYGRAVANACAKAGAERWFPNQLRHSFATEVRRRFGLDACRAVLGHTMGSRITDRYSLAALEEETIRIAAPAVEALG